MHAKSAGVDRGILVRNSEVIEIYAVGIATSVIGSKSAAEELLPPAAADAA